MVSNIDIIWYKNGVTEISLLIIGTPFFATTHTQIVIDAKAHKYQLQ